MQKKFKLGIYKSKKLWYNYAVIKNMENEMNNNELKIVVDKETKFVGVAPKKPKHTERASAYFKAMFEKFEKSNKKDNDLTMDLNK